MATVPVNNMTATWNNAGTTFTAVKMNVTNTNSATPSYLMDLQVGSVSKFNVDKTGVISQGVGDSTIALVGPFVGYGLGFDANGSIQAWNNGNARATLGVDVVAGSTGSFKFSPNSNPTSATPDLVITRDAANILAQRNSTNAQTFRVYNTFTDASNYESGVFDWTTSANVLTIGSQGAGTGAGGRRIDFVTPSTLGFFFKIAGGNSAAVQLLSSAGVIYADNFAVDFNNGDTVLSRGGAAKTIAIGSGNGDSSGSIKVKTKAGAPVAADIPASTWAVIRDTSGSTTKLYYNNAGTLQSVALA